jgi:hypothetical protein
VTGLAALRDLFLDDIVLQKTDGTPQIWQINGTSVANEVVLPAPTAKNIAWNGTFFTSKMGGMSPAVQSSGEVC